MVFITGVCESARTSLRTLIVPKHHRVSHATGGFNDGDEERVDISNDFFNDDVYGNQSFVLAG